LRDSLMQVHMIERKHLPNAQIKCQILGLPRHSLFRD
jgi:hypothetical protein